MRIRILSYVIGFVLGLAGPVSTDRARAAEYVDSPALADQVAAGKLPPLARRLPETPLVWAPPGFEPARHGGELRLLMGRAQDVRMMVVYGYARLVGYDEQLKLVPDVLARVDVVEDREFTLHLRPGHRWSDGHPFTSEDFRFFWEDIANSKALSPLGLPQSLLVDGKGPRFQGQPPDIGGVCGDVIGIINRLHRRKLFHKRQVMRQFREFHRLSAALPDGAVVLSHNREIRWFNLKAAELLGLRRKVDDWPPDR